MLHPYRSHHCEALRSTDIGQTVRLSGWIHRKRDHGGVVFIDLRDHYGLTQCVTDSTDAAFAKAEDVRNETVVTIPAKSGLVQKIQSMPISPQERLRFI